MQSWQTDLLNLCLGATLRPLMTRITSVRTMRAIIALSDATSGHLMIPSQTVKERVDVPLARFRTDWVSQGGGNECPTILYLPGGAYISRSPNMHTGLVSRLCEKAGARALVAYYRLAPEYPFPACLEDSLLAYRWLLKQGVPPEQIVIAGDSAGGGLTLSTLLALREENLPMPACAVMLSPLLDAVDTSPSRWNNVNSDKLLPPAWQRAMDPRSLFIGDTDPKNPLISPIYGDLTGLPPLYVQVSDSELLFDDSLRLARRGHQYQVNVTVDIWSKTPHVWQALPFLPESQDALEKAASFIRANVETPLLTDGQQNISSTDNTEELSTLS